MLQELKIDSNHNGDEIKTLKEDTVMLRQHNHLLLFASFTTYMTS